MRVAVKMDVELNVVDEFCSIEHDVKVMFVMNRKRKILAQILLII